MTLQATVDQILAEPSRPDSGVRNRTPDEAAAPAYLPLVQCKPWCQYQDGHPEQRFAEDQWCATPELRVDLSLEPRIGDLDVSALPSVIPMAELADRLELSESKIVDENLLKWSWLGRRRVCFREDVAWWVALYGNTPNFCEMYAMQVPGQDIRFTINHNEDDAPSWTANEIRQLIDNLQLLLGMVGVSNQPG